MRRMTDKNCKFGILAVCKEKAMNSMKDKVVLITGGSAGIGRAAVQVFVREGAKVVFAARGTERGEAVQKEVEAAGGTALFVPADVSQAGQVRDLVRVTVEKFGRLDCAFNNAASIHGILRNLADFSEAEFDDEISLNLKSIWLCMKYEIEQMTKQQPGGGTIVNTSSVNGLGGARTGGLYSAAKAGILALTKAAAQEYAQQGIRVNALVAGGFDTPGLERVIETASGGDTAKKQAIRQRYADYTPL